MPRALAVDHVRERWRMGPEARALTLVMVLVLVFGLAVLYSASAIMAEQENHNSWFYAARQLGGVLAGAVVFALAAKLDAGGLSDWAWPLTWFTLLALLLCAGGVRIAHVVIVGALAIPVLWSKVERLQYALLRIIGFLDPGQAAAQVNYQLRQSLIAVGSGGALGVGFGQGRQQYGFLPFPYSDFIASNIGEEWGFLGLAAVTLAFAAYALLGFRIARKARSPFLQLVAVGLTFVTVLTAYLHIGVVVGLLPTTRLTLPFVSYGRSNIILSMLMTGILLNIGSGEEPGIGRCRTEPLTLAARAGGARRLVCRWRDRGAYVSPGR